VGNSMGNYVGMTTKYAGQSIIRRLSGL